MQQTDSESGVSVVVRIQLCSHGALKRDVNQRVWHATHGASRVTAQTDQQTLDVFSNHPTAEICQRQAVIRV